MSRKFRSKRIDETRNYYFLILVSEITGCISIYSFASLLGITSSAIWVIPSKDLTYVV